MRNMNDTHMQEAFDIVYRGLASQNWERSVHTYGAGLTKCRYREGSLKCAFGHLIDDADYNHEFEGHGACSSVFNFMYEHVLERSITDKMIAEYPNSREIRELMITVQKVHDAVDEYDTEGKSMRERLEEVAEQFGLKIPTL